MIDISTILPVDNSVDNVDYFNFSSKGANNRMNGEVYELILHSAQEYGVLPLTSVCNVACIFCSNRQNPPGIMTHDIQPLSREQIDEIMTFLQVPQKIIIGESATRINEGEPLTHPDFIGILKRIRIHFPSAPIQVTTNGSLLTPHLAAELANMMPVEIYLSLNSSSPGNRISLMGDANAEQAVQAPGILQNFGIPYHGSLVAQPSVTGWNDIENTVSFFSQHGAKTVRIFLPGYTRWRQVHVEPVSGAELTNLAYKLTRKYCLPVLAEPPYLTDLNPVVEGVIVQSPAAQAGCMPGDVVASVNGTPVLSRYHAYQLCFSGKNPIVSIERTEAKIQFEIVKNAETPSGLVFYNDMEPQRLERFKSVLVQLNNVRSLVLTSVLAEPLLKAACQKTFGEFPNLHITAVDNEFYGGTIACSGLLTVQDLLKTIENELLAGQKPEIVFIPKEAFDYRGHDLVGRSYLELKDATGIDVMLV